MPLTLYCSCCNHTPERLCPLGSPDTKAGLAMKQRVQNLLLGSRGAHVDVTGGHGVHCPGTAYSGEPKGQFSLRRWLTSLTMPPASPGRRPAPAPGQLAEGPHTFVLVHHPLVSAAGWWLHRPGSADRAAPAGPQDSRPSGRSLGSLGTEHRPLLREGAERSLNVPPLWQIYHPFWLHKRLCLGVGTIPVKGTDPTMELPSRQALIPVPKASDAPRKTIPWPCNLAKSDTVRRP